MCFECARILYDIDHISYLYHGDIILNRSNNSVFLRLKIY